MKRIDLRTLFGMGLVVLGFASGCKKAPTSAPPQTAPTQSASPVAPAQTMPTVVSFQCEVSGGKLQPVTERTLPDIRAYWVQNPKTRTATLCRQQVDLAGRTGLKMELLACQWNPQKQACWQGDVRTIMTGDVQESWLVPNEMVRSLFAENADALQPETLRYVLRLRDPAGHVLSEKTDTLTYLFPED